MAGLPAAQVIVDLKVRDVDRVFDYAVPVGMSDTLKIGHRVLVPFGNRTVEGYVVAYPVESAVPGMKPILRMLDPEPLISAEAIKLAAWLRDEYLCLLAHGLQCFLPPGTALRAGSKAVPLQQSTYRALPAAFQPDAVAALSRAPRQLAALRLLMQQNAPLTSHQLQAAGFTPAVLQALADRGLIAKERVTVSRDPWHGRTWQRTEHQLTPAQNQALNRIKSGLQTQGRFLLFGVTGSGKTLVYLHAIAAALEKGRSAIVLVPEISLTPQAVAEFKGWFGDHVAVLHSRLSTSERADQWRRAAVGDVQVVLGARSAVFAPLHNLGLIIIDEEQEGAYKQEDTPRYHARAVAGARVAHNGVLLLGSATPSMESYAAAVRGELELLRLPERVDSKPLPTVAVVDMREELLAGNRSMFSRTLQMELHECLARREQAILFLNRRGFASFVLCRECGHTLGCTHCQVSLTYHEPATLSCHYCGHTKELPAKCPSCGSPYLRPFGAGTQRIEQEVRRLYPDARVLRMDVDTTSRKGAHEAIWRAFSQREADVLVGTQMVAKGLHFPGVTLVGVVSADTSLHFPDFRAAERTFQLLTQVAGRAGRGERPGRVVVQTYTPEHYAIVAAQNQDYEAFYRAEIPFRQRALYPPFGSLARLLITGDREEDVGQTAGRLATACMGDDVSVIGPTPAPLSRLKDRFRWHILLKGEHTSVIGAAQRALTISGKSPCQVIVDVDPVSLL